MSDDLVKRLREMAEEKHREAWGRLDGGQDLSIGAMLAEEAAARIEELEKERDEAIRQRDTMFSSTADGITKLAEERDRLAALLREAEEAHGALWRTLAGIIECPGVSPNATVRRMAAMAENALLEDRLSPFKPEPRFARLQEPRHE